MEKHAMDDKNRAKALELAIASVEKEYGKGAIMRLKDGEKLHDGVAVAGRDLDPPTVGGEVSRPDDDEIPQPIGQCSCCMSTAPARVT